MASPVAIPRRSVQPPRWRRPLAACLTAAGALVAPPAAAAAGAEGGPTPALELVCLGIVALYVVVRAARDPRPGAFLARLLALMAASWLAEDTCIRAYGFYAYDPGWSLFIDRVPILIVTIWPMVIHTAWDLARHLCRDPRRVPLLGAAIVLADASLIEPIAVAAGLWTWFEPGLFAVPPIGVLGWALFALLALTFLARHERTGARLWRLALLLPVASVGVHVALLALWWGALRWVSVELWAAPAVVAAWIIAVGASAVAVRWSAGRRVPTVELALRVPAAAFFFVLLAWHAADDLWLIAYALAFAPPYLVLTAQSLRVGPGPAGEPEPAPR